jgi:hypothetical protein
MTASLISPETEQRFLVALPRCILFEFSGHLLQFLCSFVVEFLQPGSTVRISYRRFESARFGCQIVTEKTTCLPSEVALRGAPSSGFEIEYTAKFNERMQRRQRALDRNAHGKFARSVGGRELSKEDDIVLERTRFHRERTRKCPHGHDGYSKFETALGTFINKGILYKLPLHS